MRTSKFLAHPHASGDLQWQFPCEVDALERRFPCAVAVLESRTYPVTDGDGGKSNKEREADIEPYEVHVTGLCKAM